MKIYDPLRHKWIYLNSVYGKQVLKNYITNLMSAGYLPSDEYENDVRNRIVSFTEPTSQISLSELIKRLIRNIIGRLYNKKNNLTKEQILIILNAISENIYSGTILNFDINNLGIENIHMIFSRVRQMISRINIDNTIQQIHEDIYQALGVPIPVFRAYDENQEENESYTRRINQLFINIGYRNHSLLKEISSLLI